MTCRILGVLSALFLGLGCNPEPVCTSLLSDPSAAICRDCAPVYGDLGEYLGEDCCWTPAGGGACLEPCEQAGPLSCPKGHSCLKAVDAEPFGVCWPDPPANCYPLNGDPLSLVCQRCDLFGGAACCWVASDQPDTCLSPCDEGVCDAGFACHSADTDVGGQANVCWPG